jgi:hypothetical protein
MEFISYLLGDSVNTIKENSETLLKASRDIGLEINAGKTKYMIMSRYPNSGQNQNVRITNESFEKVAKSRRMRWAGHVARMGEGRGAYRVLVGRPEGKKPL